MAVSLGKRKRPQLLQLSSKSIQSAPSSLNPDEEKRRLMDVFRKHFEAEFKPLPVKKTPVPEQVEEAEHNASDSMEEEEWSGFSEEEHLVEVVEHSYATSQSTAQDRQDLKAFMSAKPPIAKEPKAAANRAPPLDDEDSALNLKNDLALQRLLSESHLLAGETSNDLNATGKARLRALDLRFQSLGSKDSVYSPQRMPMNMRKGMVKKKQDRETKRRKEAKEAGIVLEREVRKQNHRTKRERGVGEPGIGTFRGGLLTLSRKDLQDIQSTRGHAYRRK